MIKKIKAYIEARRKKKLINSLRSHLAFFGYDVSNMTDDEVEQIVTRMGKVISRAAQVTGLTTQEARDSLCKLGTMNRFDGA